VPARHANNFVTLVFILKTDGSTLPVQTQSTLLRSGSKACAALAITGGSTAVAAMAKTGTIARPLTGSRVRTERYRFLVLVPAFCCPRWHCMWYYRYRRCGSSGRPRGVSGDMARECSVVSYLTSSRPSKGGTLLPASIRQRVYKRRKSVRLIGTRYRTT
jgi:hypothetical protein